MYDIWLFATFITFWVYIFCLIHLSCCLIYPNSTTFLLSFSYLDYSFCFSPFFIFVNSFYINVRIFIPHEISNQKADLAMLRNSVIISLRILSIKLLITRVQSDLLPSHWETCMHCDFYRHNFWLFIYYKKIQSIATELGTYTVPYEGGSEHHVSIESKTQLKEYLHDAKKTRVK